MGVEDDLLCTEGEAVRDKGSEVKDLVLEDVRGKLEPGGRLKYRFEPLGLVVLPSVALLLRLEKLIPGETSLLEPLAGPTATEEAGEDPGVSTMLPVAERSIDIMLEMESRSG